MQISGTVAANARTSSRSLLTKIAGSDSPARRAAFNWLSLLAPHRAAA